jgi:putative cardiolipin synthase
VSTALSDTDATRLGVAVTRLREPHPGLTGVLPLVDSLDAFAARAALADAAQRSLDVQYYIWRDDLSGSLLLDALRRAADRGVRVRLLLDDNNTAGLDRTLRELDGHPLVEVRLFNPFVHRQWRVLDYLGDFSRVNRRMHNKSFTADNQVTIVGGRNVGDEYFGAGDGPLFVDLDVLAIGPVVADVSADFDRYWASDSAYPIARVAGSAASAGTAVAAAPAAEALRAYRQSVAQSSFMRDLQARRLPFEWARARLVSDDPSKALGRTDRRDTLWARLQVILPRAQHELELVSPYFVPSETGTRYLAELAQRGAKVSVLTNGLASTDVVAVHAGYARYRKPLLEAGVRLFELRRDPAEPHMHGRWLGGSSASSLHAKTFAVDRTHVFVGSFNFDPRSARLNTELGVVIESPRLATRIAQQFDGDIPARSYRLRLEEGELRWEQPGPAGPVVWAREPGAGFWLKLGVRLLSLLPIEGLL